MTSPRRFRRPFRWAALVFVAGCGQRERLVFPTENPGNGAGPVTQITQPAAPDTVVTEGDLLLLQGRSYDADGVDTIYIEVGGVSQGFAPILGGGADTVDFAVQLSTLNHSGARVLVRAYGVDLLGGQGAPISRQIRID